jgi:hypothetical protein
VQEAMIRARKKIFREVEANFKRCEKWCADDEDCNGYGSRKKRTGEELNKTSVRDFLIGILLNVLMLNSYAYVLDV